MDFLFVAILIIISIYLLIMNVLSAVSFNAINDFFVDPMLHIVLVQEGMKNHTNAIRKSVIPQINKRMLSSYLVVIFVLFTLAILCGIFALMWFDTYYQLLFYVVTFMFPTAVYFTRSQLIYYSMVHHLMMVVANELKNANKLAAEKLAAKKMEPSPSK